MAAGDTRILKCRTQGSNKSSGQIKLGTHTPSYSLSLKPSEDYAVYNLLSAPTTNQSEHTSANSDDKHPNPSLFPPQTLSICIEIVIGYYIHYKDIRSELKRVNYTFAGRSEAVLILDYSARRPYGVGERRLILAVAMEDLIHRSSSAIVVLDGDAKQ